MLSKETPELFFFKNILLDNFPFMIQVSLNSYRGARKETLASRAAPAVASSSRRREICDNETVHRFSRTRVLDVRLA